MRTNTFRMILHGVFNGIVDGLAESLREIFDQLVFELLLDARHGGVLSELELDPRAVDEHAGVRRLVVEVQVRDDLDGVEIVRDFAVVVLAAVRGGHGEVGFAGQVQQAELQCGGVRFGSAVGPYEGDFTQVVLVVVETDIRQLVPVTVVEPAGKRRIVGRDLVGPVPQVRSDGLSDAQGHVVVHVAGHGGGDALEDDVFD